MIKAIVLAVVEAIVQFFTYQNSAAATADRAAARQDGANAAENETLTIIAEGADAQSQNNSQPRNDLGVAERLRADAGAAKGSC